MKLTITFEIEISDIPEKDRLEIVSDTGMHEEDMPRISEMSEAEVRSEVIDAFYALFDGSTYDEQSEMWAGSDFYGYITRIVATPSPPADVQVPTAKMLLAGSMVDWKKYDDKAEAAFDVWNAMLRNAPAPAPNVVDRFAPITDQQIRDIMDCGDPSTARIKICRLIYERTKPSPQPNERLADKIEDLIAEFGENPEVALQCISEWLSLRRHHRHTTSPPKPNVEAGGVIDEYQVADPKTGQWRLANPLDVMAFVERGWPIRVFLENGTLWNLVEDEMSIGRLSDPSPVPNVRSAKDDGVTFGIAMSVAFLLRDRDQPVPAMEWWHAAGLTIEQCEGVGMEAYDLDPIRAELAASEGSNHG